MSEKTKMPKAETFPIAMISCCGSFDDIMGDAQKLYDDQKTKFMSSDPRDEDLPEKAASWAKASQRLIGVAGSSFCRYPARAERQEEALRILDICKKDSFLREKNLMLHYELAKQTDIDAKALDKKRNAVLDSIHFCCRAQNTQSAWLKKYINGETYEPVEIKYNRIAGKRVYDMAKLIPDGHMFFPARVFPPFRVPAGERVPYSPAPWRAFKELPVDAYVYDAEHDEFMIPKGYVSEDGKLDDQSIVFNWEDSTVTCKFVGEEPITWPFWKPKTTYDVIEEGSWCEEYLKRVRKQLVQDLQPPGLET